MIHRALLGSLERFFGTLIEHYAGDFPLWLAPVQARLLPVTDRAVEYATDLKEKLSAAGVRVELDERSEKIGHKIREAELDKVPIMLILGDRESESGQVSVRRRGLGDIGSMDVKELLDGLAEEIRLRSNVPLIGQGQKKEERV